ncbi:MAG: hypothetical protein ACO36I_14615, partial [Candidatus Latescibacterota bacterium]
MASPHTQRFESNYKLDPDQITEWVDTFHKQGFLFIQNVLKEEHIAQLKKDLDFALANFPTRKTDLNNKVSGQLCMRMFEHSTANLN